MELNDNHRASLIKEIRLVVKKMAENSDARKMLYYFSGVFTLINRIFNDKFDPELVVAHLILQSVHNQFLNRLQTIRQQGDTAIELSDEQFQKLISLTDTLGKKIQKKQAIHETLNKFAILGYSTTGNGYFLMQKGILKI